ncbi:MAG: response regulator transcription factor [Patescibacteria group bacterium]
MVGVPENQQQEDLPVVLLIEDDPILAKMYSEKFTREGFRVIVAQDGQEGLDSALKNKVDIILLDIMLPRISGIDLLKKLREDEKGRNTLVVVLTNLADAEEKKRAMDLGVKDYMVKAMQNPGQVVNKVKDALSQKS